MYFTPKKNNKIITLIFILAMLLLFAVLILCRFGFLKAVVFHFTFYFEAIFFSYLLLKFVLPVYQYALIDSRFIITKTLGKKTVTHCDIDFNRIEKIITKKEYKKENATIKSVYNYNANFLASSYCLIFNYSDSREAILFEPDEKMVREIEKIISDNLLFL